MAAITASPNFQMRVVARPAFATVVTAATRALAAKPAGEFAAHDAFKTLGEFRVFMMRHMSTHFHP